MLKCSCIAASSQKSQHMRTHKERTVQCVVCDKKFLSKHHLARHEVIHTGAKSFECPTCSFKCNVQQNLRTHCKEAHNQIYPPLRSNKVARIMGEKNNECAPSITNDLNYTTISVQQDGTDASSKKIRRRRSRAYGMKDTLQVNASSVVVEDGVYPSLSADVFASDADTKTWQAASLDGVIEEAALSADPAYVSVTQEGVQVVMVTTSDTRSSSNVWTLR